MNLRTSLKVAVILISVSPFVISCNKEKERSNSEQILGTWKLEYEAEDRNHNNKLEESEKEEVKPGYYTFYTFQKDGTLIDSLDMEGVSGVHYGRYTISGQQAFLSILGRSITYNLLELNSTNLHVRDNDTPGNWLGFVRQ